MIVVMVRNNCGGEVWDKPQVWGANSVCCKQASNASSLSFKPFVTNFVTELVTIFVTDFVINCAFAIFTICLWHTTFKSPGTGANVSHSMDFRHCHFPPKSLDPSYLSVRPPTPSCLSLQNFWISLLILCWYTRAWRHLLNWRRVKTSRKTRIACGQHLCEELSYFSQRHYKKIIFDTGRHLCEELS